MRLELRGGHWRGGATALAASACHRTLVPQEAQRLKLARRHEVGVLQAFRGSGPLVGVDGKHTIEQHKGRRCDAAAGRQGASGARECWAGKIKERGGRRRGPAARAGGAHLHSVCKELLQVTGVLSGPHHLVLKVGHLGKRRDREMWRGFSTNTAAQVAV